MFQSAQQKNFPKIGVAQGLYNRGYMIIARIIQGLYGGYIGIIVNQPVFNCDLTALHVFATACPFDPFWGFNCAWSRLIQCF